MDPERLSRWDDTYRLFRRAYYNELLASLLYRRWDRWDNVSNIIVALTASGSAISGWALWHNNVIGTVFWAALAGTASVLSIFQSTVKFQARIRKQQLLRKQFGHVRVALQVVLSDIVSGQDLPKIDTELRSQKEKYSRLNDGADPDLAESRALRKRAEADLTNALIDWGYEKPPILVEGKRDGNSANEAQR